MRSVEVKQQKLIFSQLKSEKARLVKGELVVVEFPPCSHTISSACTCAQISSSERDTSPTGSGPTRITPFYLNNCPLPGSQPCSGEEALCVQLSEALSQAWWGLPKIDGS